MKVDFRQRARTIAQQPLSDAAAEFVMKHGLAKDHQLAGFLRHKNRDEAVAQEVGAHANVVLSILNECAENASTILGSGDGLPTCGQFNAQLRTGERLLCQRLHEQIPELSDEAVHMVVDFFNRWRWRLYDNVKHLSREHNAPAR